MDKAKSSETGYLGNMLDFPANKEERVLAHILATKFHTESAIDSWLEVKLNPTMKDLFIRPTAKKKRSKQQKKEESTAEAAESVGENQPVWLDSLKEEIAKLK
jgi:hypothetical protein